MPKLLHGTIEKNKLKIERAPLQLFTRKGFHGTTVREIANRAGISMGKLYIYYDTKEDIFIDLVHHLGRKMEIIRQKELIPLMASMDPDSLKKLATAIGRVVSENLDYWRLMYIDVVEFRHKHWRSTRAMWPWRCAPWDSVPASSWVIPWAPLWPPRWLRKSLASYPL